MPDKTLKFNNIRVTKKGFYKSKKPLDLISVTVDQIFASDKYHHNNEGFKNFIGYQEDEIAHVLFQIKWVHKILWIWGQKHVFFY